MPPYMYAASSCGACSRSCASTQQWGWVCIFRRQQPVVGKESSSFVAMCVQEARERLRQQSFQSVAEARSRIKRSASESIVEAQARIAAEDAAALAEVHKVR